MALLRPSTGSRVSLVGSGHMSCSIFCGLWEVSCPWAVGSCAVIVGLLFDLLWFGNEWRGRVSHGMEVCELSFYCRFSAERFIEYFKYPGWEFSRRRALCSVSESLHMAGGPI